MLHLSRLHSKWNSWAIYGNRCTDVKNVRKWVLHAKSCNKGEMSASNDQRPWWPTSVTHDANQCKVDVMIQENHRIKFTVRCKSRKSVSHHWDTELQRNLCQMIPMTTDTHHEGTQKNRFLKTSWMILSWRDDFLMNIIMGTEL